MKLTFEQLIEEHGQWADATFPKATAEGALIHAMREADEVINDLNNGATTVAVSFEVADVLGCLFDAGRRHGIDAVKVAKMLDMLCESNVTLLMVKCAFAEKLEINKSRKWKDNGDGSYSHIKSQTA